ncbi:MAG: YmdB family metallophosphoesterase [Spirochaetales bacterium]|nr:YmdB family metallophosphoesterase [Spirochaetales bacterium]MBR1583365.1 YmdB family metallophosphoesterase [Spirochaetales bacterium]
MRVLFLGEIVGRCGIGVIKNALKTYRRENGVDLVIANGEGATSGFGLGFQNALSLQHMGIDVLTMGEKSFFKLDMVEGISKRSSILRPANYPEDVPGRGVRYISVGERKVCIINTLGMCNFNNPHLNNPFLGTEALLNKIHTETNTVFYVFHASATAEKMAMGRMLQGKVSAVVGTHSKVMTADARILDGGTAYITDLGRCGASVSVGGFEPEHEIRKFRTSVQTRSHESWEKPQMQGLLVDVDDQSGKAIGVSPVRLDVAVEIPAPKNMEEK